MIRHTMRLGLMAALIWATLPAVTGFPKAQNNSPHPLEGLYEVSATRTDTGNGFKFLVSLTRDGGKWVGAVREAVIPVTVKEVTVTGENRLTGIATADGGGKTISFTVKVEGNKITLNVSVGENAATLTATKKATEGKDAATVEGTYEGQTAPEGQKTFPVELIIKRIKPADK
ncbi:MAG TPA: hypothetical protein VFV58_07710 [Blastocatellia bacterium]|nr:hypothetical protein [Blastocatellia bacterium]